MNDLSERAFQLEVSGGQWSRGKSCAGFCPTGPYLVTPDEFDPTGLRLRRWVNGEPRQDSTTADLIFGVKEIVHSLSHYLVLEPGDLVCTGTPEGVALSKRFPCLRAGDVEIEVEGLGRRASGVHRRMMAQTRRTERREKDTTVPCEAGDAAVGKYALGARSQRVTPDRLEPVPPYRPDVVPAVTDHCGHICAGRRTLAPGACGERSRRFATDSAEGAT